MKTVSKKKQKQIEQGSTGSSSAAALRGASENKAPISAPFGILNASRSVPKVCHLEELISLYEFCETMDKSLSTGLHILHDAVAWIDFYVRQNPGMKRALRALIQIQTIQALLRGRYYLSSSQVSTDDAEELALVPVRLDRKDMIAPAFSSIKYESDHHYGQLNEPSPHLETVIKVMACDCLEVALAMETSATKTPLVLDMASMSVPGGGWRKASAAQEENLHRRTNLMHCLEDPYHVNPDRKWDYPIPQFGGLYIPNVTVFRGSEAKGYPFLDIPRKVSIVASAALKMPPTETDPHTGEEVLDRKLARDTLRKIEAILAIAAEHQHTSLVLSAYGCGAYMNPPGHIARLFKAAIHSERFRGRFANICFAIIDTEAEISSASCSSTSSSSAPHANPGTGPSSSSPSSQSSITPTKVKTHKAIIFARELGVDVLDLNGTVLYTCSNNQK